jgi:BirA family transcriptional regulator, biotin operon repressor / biotin---[acetyl-CoA-carboxylase] ligase
MIYGDSMLQQRIIKQKLHHFFQTVNVVETIGSTHVFIKENLTIVSSGDVMLAREQQSGIGTQGRVFFSPKDKGIYCSFCLDINRLPLIPTLLPIVVGIAICDVLDSNYNIKASIQWVNDVVINHQKVAGVLCEQVGETMIISFGVNVYETQYPTSIRSKSTNVSLHNKTVNINDLTATVLNQIIEIITNKNTSQIIDFFNLYHNQTKLNIRIDDDIKSVDVITIDEAGRLIVMDSTQQKIILYSANQIVKD